MPILLLWDLCVGSHRNFTSADLAGHFPYSNGHFFGVSHGISVPIFRDRISYAGLALYILKSNRKKYIHSYPNCISSELGCRVANCCCGNPWPDIAWGGAEWVGGAWDAACGAAWSPWGAWQWWRSQATNITLVGYTAKGLPSCIYVYIYIHMSISICKTLYLSIYLI